MFGNGMTEWLLVAVVALLVLGPERLPTLVRSAGRAAGKVRGMWSEVQKELNDSLPQDEVKELAENVRALRGQTNVKQFVRRLAAETVDEERKQG
ncbi:MAG: twin-arginine translocase subunit TatB [Pseudomonadales bacterium]|nr:twin-arginine translocase subunit TatB [Pseudomonadales bacterium]|tara:strand:- start:838 stop:1122 length:285 start_codon:yes stop_codon:yes gene_type:complete